MSADGWAAIMGGLSALITSIALLVSVLGVHRKVNVVAKDVATANGILLGELAEQDEGRRVDKDILPAERTASEQGYVDRLRP